MNIRRQFIFPAGAGRGILKMKLITVVSLTGVALALCSCNSMDASNTSFGSSSTSNVTSGGNNNGGGNNNTAPVAQVAIPAVSLQQMNLGVSLTVPVQIQSANGYSGPVNLSIDNKVLAANDPMSTISVSIAPASVDVSPGTPGMATVSVVSQSSSPDLSSYVNVVANTPNGTCRARFRFK